MPSPTISPTTAAKCELPPLILHPFSGGGGEQDLLAGSRASLALHGLLETSEEEAVLMDRLLAGHYQEIRMLVFLGKDIFRWLHQCVDFMRRSRRTGPQGLHLETSHGVIHEPSAIHEPGVNLQSFAALVVEDPPQSVRAKLEAWGVTDRRAVFSRALGIHSLLEDPPARNMLSPIFLNNYHRFADHAYICFQHLVPFKPLDSSRFQFDIYASEEYSRMLSDQWEKV